jgi:hypothetical protein
MNKWFEFIVQKPASIIDEPKFFKQGIEYLFRILAFSLLAYGVYAIIANLIEYFDLFSKMNAWQIIRAILMIIIGLGVSIAGYVYMAGLLWKRADDIRNEEKTCLLDLIPRVIKTTGEVIAIFMVTIGVVNLFAAILAMIPIFPFSDVYNTISLVSQFGLPDLIPGLGVDGFKEYISQIGVDGLGGMVMCLLLAFLNLALMYLLAAFYKVLLAFFRGIPWKTNEM